MTGSLTVRHRAAHRRTLVTWLASLSLVGVWALAACRGFKEAMTAHVDVVAHAGSQELSVTRLGTLVGRSKAPLQKEFVRQLAQMWVDYQLLGQAAASNDSLNQPAVESDALWAVTANAKAKHWFEQLSKQWIGTDSAHFADKYASGEALAARHILLTPAHGDSSAAGLDSVRKKAVALRAQLTPANFADLAKKNSQDPGTAVRGGDLGVFGKGQMVPPFEAAVIALKPGTISQPVKTQFGYHLIYRPTYSEVKDAFDKAVSQRTMQHAESTYFQHLDSVTKVHVTSNAVTTTRAVAQDLEGHRNDKTPIATSTLGDFTAAALVKWLYVFPPTIRTQLIALPDTAIPGFIRNVVRNDMILHQADSAHVMLDTSETNGMRRTYVQLITNAWTQLGVDPKMLSDSAKTPADRERLAAAHVEDFLDRLLSRSPSVRYVDVPQPLDAALRGKYQSEVSETGLDRALARATEVRKSADSARVAAEPPSAVPLPGGPGVAGANAAGAAGATGSAGTVKKP